MKTERDYDTAMLEAKQYVDGVYQKWLADYKDRRAKRKKAQAAAELGDATQGQQVTDGNLYG